MIRDGWLRCSGDDGFGRVSSVGFVLTACAVALFSNSAATSGTDSLGKTHPDGRAGTHYCA
jgi:hypothetical protein